MHEAAIARNRRRIVLVAAIGLLNWWVSAIAFTVAVVVGTLVALLFEGVVESFDLDLARALIRWLPDVIGAVATFAGLGFIVVGTIVAVALMVGRLARVEHQVLRETRSHVLDHGQEGRAGELLAGLTIAAGIPPVRVALVDDPALNSFAVGRKPEQAIVGVTRGLVDGLTRDELEAVLAYQLSRVASRDVALSTWTVALTGRTMELVEGTDRVLVALLLYVPARLAARLQAVALRGQMEQRDLVAIRFTRHPTALLAALAKLDEDTAVVAGVSAATAPLWVEHPGDPAAAPVKLPQRITALRAMLGEVP